MPNIAALVGESMSCLSKRFSARDEDLKLAEELFAHIGKTIIMEESRINAVTAISGSGPAYIADLFVKESLLAGEIPPEKKKDISERLTNAALKLGFNMTAAKLLVDQPVEGTFKLMKIIPAQELKKQVTSKGGTTEAALKVIHDGGSWDDAALAALKRAEELSKKE
jgi:pyrroline-5-carboxylate reductase